MVVVFSFHKIPQTDGYAIKLDVFNTTRVVLVCQRQLQEKRDVDNGRGEFISGKINKYLHFQSFLKTDKAQAIEILHCGKQRSIYLAWLMPLLLMT